MSIKWASTRKARKAADKARVVAAEQLSHIEHDFRVKYADATDPAVTALVSVASSSPEYDIINGDGLRLLAEILPGTPRGDEEVMEYARDMWLKHNPADKRQETMYADIVFNCHRERRNRELLRLWDDKQARWWSKFPYLASKLSNEVATDLYHYLNNGDTRETVLLLRDERTSPSIKREFTNYLEAEATKVLQAFIDERVRLDTVQQMLHEQKELHRASLRVSNALLAQQAHANRVALLKARIDLST